MKKKENQENRQYDKIFKENIEHIFLAFCQRYLQIEIEKTEEIKDKLQTTIEREPDFLKIIYPKNQEKFILQIEFQTKNEEGMLLRMREYHAILTKKYKITMKQIVLYLGETPSKMPTRLEEKDIFKGFDLLSLHNIDYKNFVNSEIP
jgi:beta-xylosidase